MKESLDNIFLKGMNRKLGLFYNKHGLQNTLVGVIDQPEQVKTTSVGRHVIFYDEVNEVVGFNLIQADTVITNLHEGFIYPSIDLLKQIEELLGINLARYYHQKSLIVGEVLNYEPIRDTHLRNCQINIGLAKPLKILCGADNFHQNVGVVVALDGCILPDGKIIKTRKIHGEYVSEGMLCSYRELNLPSSPEEDQGIICLPLDQNQNKVGNEFLRPYVILKPQF